MERSIEIEAKSEEQAIQLAAEQLGVLPEQVEVELVEETRGMLGLGRPKTVRVKVRVKDGEAWLIELVEHIVGPLVGNIAVSLEDQEEALWVDLRGDNLGLLIGRHGQTLEALQLLLGIISKRAGLIGKRLVIDVEGYRRKRQKDVEALAERVIGSVLARREPVSLRPMNAFDRKTVHTVVGEYSGVTSSSSGEEPERFVTIFPADSST